MKSSFDHAVVALDQSQASDIIVDALPHLKKLGLEKVSLVTVLSISFTGEKTEINTDKYKEKLSEYKKALEKEGLTVDTELRAGTYFYPPTEILTAADKMKADFVIIGSRGYSLVQEMLLGSTASEVLHRASLPVFLVNIEMGWDEQDPKERKLFLSRSFDHALNHVLHPTDFSDTADRAFEVVRDLDAEGKIKKISLAHVQGHHAIALKDPASLDELTKQNRENLEEMRNILSDQTRETAEIIITFGTSGKEIIQIIEERDITMAIMGSQGQGFVNDFFLGGVSSQVTRFCKIPVLLIPAKRD